MKKEKKKLPKKEFKIFIPFEGPKRNGVDVIVKWALICTHHQLYEDPHIKMNNLSDLFTYDMCSSCNSSTCSNRCTSTGTILDIYSLKICAAHVIVQHALIGAHQLEQF